MASSMSLVLREWKGQKQEAEVRIRLREREFRNEAHLIVSEGVTANTASIIPAPRPAVKSVREEREFR